MKKQTQKLEQFKQAVVRFFKYDIWHKDVKQLPGIRKAIYQWSMILFLVVRGFFKEHIWIRASSLVFSTLLAIVPMLAVIFSLLKGFGFHRRLEPALQRLFAPLGQEKIETITPRVIEFLDNIDVGALGVIGLMVLLFSVFSVVSTIEGAFNSIWQIRKSRSFHRRLSDYFSFLLLGPFLLIIIPGFTAYIQQISIIHSIGETTGLDVFFRRFWTLLASWLLFYLFYVFIPNTRVKLKSALVGAIAAGTIWQIVNFAFTQFFVTAYQTGPSGALYSSFATIPLFLIWLYISWAIILLGGEICFTHQNHKLLGWQIAQKSYSSKDRLFLSIKILILLSRQFYQGKKPLTSTELSNTMQLAEPQIDSMLNTLIHTGLIYIVEDEELRYSPAKSLNTLTIRDVITALQENGDEFELDPDKFPVDAVLSTIRKEYDTAMDELFSDWTFEMLVQKDKAETIT
ncbi:MAG: YihY/virulence factor BrkB family protein [candidate division KSB1 bacterium]|nr:YihY/virulence factor BrkB family protein [candidate division KSB1 bacterium]